MQDLSVRGWKCFDQHYFNSEKLIRQTYFYLLLPRSKSEISTSISELLLQTRQGKGELNAHGPVEARFGIELMFEHGAATCNMCYTALQKGPSHLGEASRTRKSSLLFSRQLRQSHFLLHPVSKAETPKLFTTWIIGTSPPYSLAHDSRPASLTANWKLCGTRVYGVT